MDDFRKDYSLPKAYVILVDKDQDRQFIAMEFLGGDNFISFEKIFAHHSGRYIHLGVE